MTLDWAHGVVKDTNSRLQGEYEAAYKRFQDRTDFGLEDVISALEGEKKGAVGKGGLKKGAVETPDDIAYNASIDDAIKVFKQPMENFELGENGELLNPHGFPERHSFAWVEDKRMELFKKYKESYQGRQELKAADVQATKTASDAIRSWQYSKLGDWTGKGQYWETLKKKQFNLLDINDIMSTATKHLNVQQGQFYGFDIYDARLSAYANVLSAGKRGGATFHPGNILELFRGGPEKVAASKVGRAFTPTSTNTRMRKASELMLGRTPHQGEEEK